MADDRKRAIALKAADAKTLLQRQLPYVLSVLTPAQLAQVQRALDAEVVNPEIAKEANEVYRKSVKQQAGALVVRDERMVHRAYRIAATQIKAGESDHHIRLDYHRLLTADALRPATDNPDEADYLRRVRNTLESKGIWLRFDKQLVHDPEAPGESGRWVMDPRTFRAWLCVGYDGDAIPTNDGQLDREELLGTVLFGAGYYDAVHRGPTQRSLERQIAILSDDIDSGIAEHNRLIHAKSQGADRERHLGFRRRRRPAQPIDLGSPAKNAAEGDGDEQGRQRLPIAAVSWCSPRSRRATMRTCWRSTPTIRRAEPAG